MAFPFHSVFCRDSSLRISPDIFQWHHFTTISLPSYFVLEPLSVYQMINSRFSATSCLRNSVSPIKNSFVLVSPSSLAEVHRVIEPHCMNKSIWTVGTEFFCLQKLYNFIFVKTKVFVWPASLSLLT